MKTDMIKHCIKYKTINERKLITRYTESKQYSPVTCLRQQINRSKVRINLMRLYNVHMYEFKLDHYYYHVKG